VSATSAIQIAIYGVLSADAVIPTLSLTRDAQTGILTTVGVYNDSPEGADYPHVLISKATETPWHTFGTATTGLGWKNIIRIHTYSRYQGDTEALGIHYRIVALLNFQPLTVTGYTSALVEYESLRVFVEDIEKIETRHLVDEFCVMVKQ
jgi:hypothetical protein